GPCAPYGGRNRHGEAPVTPAIAWLVEVICPWPPPAMLGWLQLWLPIACPSRTIRCSVACPPPTFWPSTKNVAGEPWRRSTSRNRGVCTPGPSSKVRAIRLRVDGPRVTTVGPDAAQPVTTGCRTTYGATP